MLAALALGLAACGSGSPDASSTASTPATPKADGKVTASYDEPAGAAATQAQEILQAGGVDGIAAGFTKSFKLPADVRIHVVNGSVGPNYDPAHRTITLSYGFASYVGNLLLANFPTLRRDQRELGREWAAINDFILVHEWGHALIDLYDLPVLGKEEDAADALATVFMTRFVAGGAEYAFDAAKFFDALSARQRKLAEDDYWDAHSLDKQRAYSIVCGIAGADESDYAIIEKAGILSADRLRSCPAEYQQRVKSWLTLLRPHVRAG
ncbi:MAG: hypothetical protein JWM73_377 [Solirubrobacterales bacterium]|nr:hypothetical protein [Solirubrobacterales bacterium]